MNAMNKQTNGKVLTARRRSQKISSKNVTLLITIWTWIIIILVWSIITRLGLISRVFLPAPVDVARAGAELVVKGYLGKTLFVHLGISLLRVLGGWSAACVLAIPLGLAMGLYRKVRAAFDSFIQFFRPLPPLGYYPILVLWFGIGDLSKWALLFLAAIPLLAVGSSEAVKEVHLPIIQGAQSLGAKRFQMFFRIILPGSMPGIITAMRVSLGFTYTVLVAAEIVGARSGIGWVVWDASRHLRADIIFVGIILMGLTGIGIDYGIRTLGRHLLRWK